MKIRKLVATAVVTSVLSSGSAAEVAWTGSGDGCSWGDKDNWSAGSLPGVGDTAVFPLVKDSGTNTVYEVAVDDGSLPGFLKAASVASAEADVMTCRIVIDAESDFISSVALSAGIELVKRGAGCMTFGENTQSAYYNGRLTVEEGLLQLATNRCATAGVAYNYGHVKVGKNGVLVLGDTVDTCANWQTKIMNVFATLNSAGTVSNASGSARYIRTMDNSGSIISGSICGNGDIRFLPYGSMSITSVDNTFSGEIAPYTSSNPMVFGIAKIGKKSDTASSIGKVGEMYMNFYGGLFAYLGTGETTDKTFKYSDSNKTPVGWDAGETGGVTFEGKWYTGSPNKMKRMLLTGSNTEKPCILANEISSVDGNADDGVDYSVYITKKGSGIWRFNDHDKRYNDGVIAVEEGTLQYESIAPKGEMCSLGRASALHEDYDGAYDADRIANYAYLLGGGATKAVFEYVGAEAASCSDRPIALKGDATVSSVAAPLELAGFSSLDGAGKTLTVSGGTATDGSVISDVIGRISLVKEGSGEWTLAGDAGFSGALEVREGVLNLSCPQYTWFRLIVTGTHGRLNGNVGTFGWLRFQEIALYDAEGRRQNVGLERMPETIAAGYPASDTDWGDQAEELDYGQIIIGRNGKFYVQTSYFIDKLVDDAIGNPFVGVYYGVNAYTQTPSESNPVIFVMRLGKDAPAVVAYDICSSENDDSGNKGDWPAAFRFEGSVNGRDWITLHEVTNAEVPGISSWYSDGQAFVSGEIRKGKGYAFTPPPLAENALKNISSLSVAVGASIVDYGDSAPVSRLIVDAVEGAGSFEGVSLAETGTLELRNCPTGVREFFVPFTFAGAEADAFARWTVLVDGYDRTGSVAVTVVEDGLRVRRKGFMMFVR